MKNPKVTLALFAIILFAPMLVAWILVQKGNAHQFRLNNHGDIISPAVNVSDLSLYDLNKKISTSGKFLQGKWWLVYVAPQKCQQTCHAILYNMRQIRTALGKEAPRLERLFIADPLCEQSVCETYLNENYPEMQKIKVEASHQKLFEDLGDPIAREMVGELFIIDPKGNIMMHYAAESEARDILSDLKRLLKVSKIG